MIALMLWLHFGFHEFVQFEAEPDLDRGVVWQGDQDEEGVA